MSVAFRRDSDEEHLEPKFELPIPAGPNLVTARGFDLIERRVAELRRDLATAADEPAIALIKRDLRYWQSRQITAKIAPRPSGERVEFGVRVHLLLKGKPKSFWIVGDDEAEPAAGTVSFKAPLSQAILGAEVDETVSFGGTEEAIRIVAIDLPEATAG
jgi:transcription elongation GreA/GreB family factor